MLLVRYANLWKTPEIKDLGKVVAYLIRYAINGLHFAENIDFTAFFTL